MNSIFPISFFFGRSGKKKQIENGKVFANDNSLNYLHGILSRFRAFFPQTEWQLPSTLTVTLKMQNLPQMDFSHRHYFHFSAGLKTVKSISSRNCRIYIKYQMHAIRTNENFLSLNNIASSILLPNAECLRYYARAVMHPIAISCETVSNGEWH